MWALVQINEKQATAARYRWLTEHTIPFLIVVGYIRNTLLAGWLAGCLAAWLTGLLVACLSVWLSVCLSVCLLACLAVCLSGWLAG